MELTFTTAERAVLAEACMGHVRLVLDRRIGRNWSDAKREETILKLLGGVAQHGGVAPERCEAAARWLWDAIQEDRKR